MGTMAEPRVRQTSSTPLLQDQEQPTVEEEQASEAESDDESTDCLQCCSCSDILALMLAPVTGHEGGWSVVCGLLTVIVAGSMVGLAMPKNENLPTPWYREVSAAIGYTYFIAWSVSFYPQVVTNYKRKTTMGLSADFCGLNVIGFACYTAYNAAFFFSTYIQQEYKRRHPNSEITVQSNDVAFAVHALVLATVTMFQIGYYDGFLNRPSKTIESVIIGILVVIAVTFLLVLLGLFDWLDYLYLLSYIKILISLIKYVPQVILNYRRKSTMGWSIWQILLDFTGGVLSDSQLVFDCFDLHDWTGISGNVAKFLLGFVSIMFDTIFLLQHYVWYPDRYDESDVDSGPMAEDSHALL